jgi:hypothetical protein
VGPGASGAFEGIRSCVERRRRAPSSASSARAGEGLRGAAGPRGVNRATVRGYLPVLLLHDLADPAPVADRPRRACSLCAAGAGAVGPGPLLDAYPVVAIRSVVADVAEIIALDALVPLRIAPVRGGARGRRTALAGAVGREDTIRHADGAGTGVILGADRPHRGAVLQHPGRERDPGFLGDLQHGAPEPVASHVQVLVTRDGAVAARRDADHAPVEVQGGAPGISGHQPFISAPLPLRVDLPGGAVVEALDLQAIQPHAAPRLRQAEAHRAVFLADLHAFLQRNAEGLRLCPGDILLQHQQREVVAAQVAAFLDGADLCNLVPGARELERVQIRRVIGAGRDLVHGGRPERAEGRILLGASDGLRRVRDAVARREDDAGRDQRPRAGAGGGRGREAEDPDDGRILQRGDAPAQGARPALLPPGSGGLGRDARRKRRTEEGKQGQRAHGPPVYLGRLARGPPGSRRSRKNDRRRGAPALRQASSSLRRADGAARRPS